jgi:hypothetical protein
LVNPVKLYTPEVFAVTLAVFAPVRFTVAPEPPVPLMVPPNVKVCVEEKFAVALAPLIVTAWLVGVIRKPDFVGVTV